MSTTVLCTSVGNDGFQGIYRALRLSPDPIEIVGVDADPHAYGLYLSDHGHVVPFRKERERLIVTLVEICRGRQVELLLPLSTEDVHFFAAYREVFEERGVSVAVSPLRSIEIANDKHRLFDQARELGLPVPRFRHVLSVRELEAALDEFQADRHPVVIKKQFSTGAQGVKIVRPEIPAIQRFFSRDNIVISLDDLRRWLAQIETFPPLQVCEFLPDARYSVDVFLDQGEARCAVVRAELARLYDMSVVGVTVQEQEVEEIGVTVAEALEFEYTVCVQVGIDRRGESKLIEVNPRFPASVDHTVLAGCNMPLWTVAAALDRPYEISQPEIGTRYLRHWTSFAPPAWLSTDRA